MDLSKIPTQLTRSCAAAWRKEILGMTGCDTNELEDRLNVARSTLSRFLNGHGRTIYQWLKPNDYGEALAEIIGGTVEDIRQRYRSILPRPDGSVFDASTLRWIPIRVTWPGTPERTKATGPSIQWFDENASEDLKKATEGDDSLLWSDLARKLRRLAKKNRRYHGSPTIHLMASSSSDRGHLLRDADELAVHLGRRRIEALASETALEVSDGRHISDSEESLLFDITFLPIDIDAVDRWLNTLNQHGHITAEQTDQVRSCFETLPVEDLGQFAPEHLIYAIRDILDGDLDGYTFTEFHRRRTEWVRRDLRADATPMAKTWLSRTIPFFSRWIEYAGTLGGDVSTADIKEILDIENPGDTDLVDLVDEMRHCLLTDDDEERTDLTERVLKKLPMELKTELTKSGLLRRDGDRWWIEPELQKLGESELAQRLTTDQLQSIDVNASFFVITRRIRLAESEELGTWCETALNIDGLDQPQAISSVLEGLTSRRDAAHTLSRKTLVRLWASAVWANIWGLHRTSLDSSYFQWTAVLASRQFRNRLPFLNDRDNPVDSLRRHVDPRILKTVDHWWGADRPSTRTIIENLCKCAPFQVPFESIAGLPENKRFHVLHTTPRIDRDRSSASSRGPGEIELYHARRGNQRARQAILQGDTPDAYDALKNVEATEFLEWWHELATDDEIDVDTIPASSLRYAFTHFIESPDDDLGQTLRKVLEDESIRPDADDRETGRIQKALEALRNGPIEALIWLYSEYKWADPPRPRPCRVNPAKILLALAHIANDQAFLRELVTTNPLEIEEVADVLVYSQHVLSGKSRRDSTLQFPFLRHFARLRHEALKLLTTLGDPEPLRDSVDARWSLPSSRIAEQRAVWRVLIQAILHPLSSSENLPLLDDEMWAGLLDAILLSQKELHRMLRRDIELGKPTDDDHLSITAYSLAIRSAPTEDRWVLLSPYFASIWRRRSDIRRELPKLWNGILDVAEPTDDDSIWREPDKLYEKREEWALRNDPESMRRWCETHFREDQPHDYRAVQRVTNDLDGFGEAAWPHLKELSVEARSRILMKIESCDEKSLPEDWWARAMDLSHEDRLEFARKHGTSRRIRQEIAEPLINSRDDATEKLHWWCRLDPEERPHPQIIKRAIEQFVDEPPEAPLSYNEYEICLNVSQVKRSLTSIPKLLPVLFVSRAIYALQAEEKNPSHEDPFQDLPPARLIKGMTPALRDMSPTARNDLYDRLQELETRILKAANKDEELQSVIPEYQKFLSGLQTRILRTLDEAISGEDSKGSATTVPAAMARIKELPFNPDDSQHSLSKLWSIIFDLPEDKRPHLLKRLLAHNELARNPQAFREVIKRADRYDLAPQEVMPNIRTQLDRAIAYATDSESPQHRRRELIRILSVTAEAVDRTEIRHLLRSHAEAQRTTLSGSFEE